MLPGGDLVSGKRGAVLADGTSGVCGACAVPRNTVAFETSQAPLTPQIKPVPLVPLVQLVPLEREPGKSSQATGPQRARTVHAKPSFHSLALIALSVSPNQGKTHAIHSWLSRAHLALPRGAKP